MASVLEERIIAFYEDFCVVVKHAGENAETDVPKLFEPVITQKLGRKPELIACPHRLDMPVSGVQIISFSKKNFEYFTNVFSNKLAQKTYFAIVEGVDFQENEGMIENYLVFSPEKKKAYVYDYEKRKAKKAVLEYRIFAKGERYSYLTVEPKTGRTHQIRAQLAGKGMHIKGDVKYGARRADTLDGIRLFAYSIELPLPSGTAALSPVSSSEAPKSGPATTSSAKQTVHSRFEAPLPAVDPLWQDFLDKYNAVKSSLE